MDEDKEITQLEEKISQEDFNEVIQIFNLYLDLSILRKKFFQKLIEVWRLDENEDEI